MFYRVLQKQKRDLYRIVAIKTPPKAEEDTYNNIYVRILDTKIAKLRLLTYVIGEMDRLSWVWLLLGYLITLEICPNFWTAFWETMFPGTSGTIILTTVQMCLHPKNIPRLMPKRRLFVNLGCRDFQMRICFYVSCLWNCGNHEVPCLRKRDMLCNAPRWHSVKLSVKELRRENAQKKVRLNVPSACKPEVHLEALLITIFDIAWKRQLWSFWISVIKNKAVANKSQTSIAAPQLGLHGSACHRDISLGLRK